MKPPGAPAEGKSANSAHVDPAVSVCLGILRKRTDFLKAAKAARQNTPGFTLQARKRTKDEDRTGIFVGYTCSKKIGNAVARNRAKRRLREIARAVIPEFGQQGWDYVLIGRHSITADRPMTDLISDLKSALAKLHQQKK